MQFLAVSTNTKDVSEYLADEFARIDELRREQVLTAGWVKADYSGAVFIVDAQDEAAARAALGTLPIARSGATSIGLTAVVDLDSVRSG